MRLFFSTDAKLRGQPGLSAELAVLRLEGTFGTRAVAEDWTELASSSVRWRLFMAE
jgi:hypothetical protein